MNKQAEFKADLNQRYWKYQKMQFPHGQKYFERPYAPDGRPPVFIRAESWRNVIVNPKANQKEINRILALVPNGEKHTWFGSMNSSQALAQSVFGNLPAHDFLHCLAELKCDEGLDLFGEAQISAENFAMEYKVDYLGEPRPTSLDGHLAGDYQIAIECKFTEAEVGACSRPKLKKSASNYNRDYCK